MTRYAVTGIVSESVANTLENAAGDQILVEDDDRDGVLVAEPKGGDD